jgi:hypothetical protein
MPTQEAAEYRLAPAVRMQLLGSALVVPGILVLVVALLAWLLDLPGAVLGVALVVAAVAVVGLGLLAVRPRPVVTLDEHGYRLRVLRSAGVRQAAWRDVEDLVTATLRGQDCAVLRLRDGRTTTIPVRLLDTDPDAFVRQVSSYLDRGRGYRRLPR